MIALYQSYYKAPTVERFAENLECLKKNVLLSDIGRIYLFIDDESEPPVEDDKIEVIRIKERPTYNLFFEAMRRNGHEYNVLSNTDIFFNGTISKIKQMGDNDCYALSRYEPYGSGWQLYHAAVCSQDTWIFKGSPKEVNGNFSLGRPGCDNRIAWELSHAGYNVTNPAHTIITHHVHQSNQRFYTQKEAVPEPYMTIQPTAL